jgi:hypothetical protein
VERQETEEKIKYNFISETEPMHNTTLLAEGLNNFPQVSSALYTSSRIHYGYANKTTPWVTQNISFSRTSLGQELYI